MEIIALITAILTPILFFIGHFAAYLYYSSFDIPYFKYTNTHTAFSFALESMDVVLSLIAIAIIGLISFGTVHSFSHDYEHVKIKKIKFRYLLKLVPKVLVIMILVLFVINYFGGIISSSELKKEIKEKRFIPFEVTYNQGKNVSTCVTSLGSLGQFQVFLTSELQPFLIRENSLLEIKQLFSSPPLKEIPRGKGSVDNPNYSAELKIWYKKWESVCGNKPANKFEIFEFTKHGEPKPPRK